MKASVLTENDVKIIFDLYDREAKNNRRSVITKMVFATGIYTGLRINEILSLRYSDIFHNKISDSKLQFQKKVENIKGVNNVLVVKRSKKRNKVVYGEIPINLKLAVMFYDYGKFLDKNYYINLDMDRWLFPGRVRERLADNVVRYSHLSIRAINMDFAEKGKLLNIPQFSSHSMRRTALNALYESGVDLKLLQTISGHESPSELLDYLDVNPTRLKDAINSLPY